MQIGCGDRESVIQHTDSLGSKQSESHHDIGGSEVVTEQPGTLAKVAFQILETRGGAAHSVVQQVGI